MVIDAVVRVSFQSETEANQAVNNALVGHPQDATGNGPFTKEGTALYRCTGTEDDDFKKALSQLVQAVNSHIYALDHVFLYITRQ